MGFGLAVVGLAYALLLVGEGEPPAPQGAGRPVFAWRLDAFWSQLEQEMVAARRREPAQLAAEIDAAVGELRQLLAQVAAHPRAPDDPIFATLEERLFRLAPLVAVQPERVKDYAGLVAETREGVKEQSRAWDPNALPARQRLYRLLFGARMALEQVLLQLPADRAFPALGRGVEEPSAAPATSLLGVTVHSGDILVSRGGAPTSALIARGNDYPGVFSHVALVHVDPDSRRAVTVESHIEGGVVVAPLAAYLRDQKLRVLVLRPRADLPALQADPLLPHRAASQAVAEAARRHIPYDFAMNGHDASAQFCSEVAAVAYAAVGLKLWMGVSYLSSPTVTAWLGSIGVRHFETQEPADLEYDPQLRVVAEWRDRATLFKAHVDDAVTDVMFEVAPSGEPLPYNRRLLPLARLSKAYSVGLNLLGRVGPIPEGMSATAALRVDRYQAAHRALVARVRVRAEALQSERGYVPPYWELVRLAREAERQQRGG
jgi:hypothetical protein